MQKRIYAVRIVDISVQQKEEYFLKRCSCIDRASSKKVVIPCSRKKRHLVKHCFLTQGPQTGGVREGGKEKQYIFFSQCLLKFGISFIYECWQQTTAIIVPVALTPIEMRHIYFTLQLLQVSQFVICANQWFKIMIIL